VVKGLVGPYSRHEMEALTDDEAMKIIKLYKSPHYLQIKEKGNHNGCPIPINALKGESRKFIL
jgi:hypothetical protein